MIQDDLSIDPQVLRKQELDQQIEEARGIAELPRIYVNGFILSANSGDVLFVLKLNDQSVAMLNMPYGVAKTLAQKLGNLIAVIEDKTGHSFLTTDEFNAALGEDKNE